MQLLVLGGSSAWCPPRSAQRNKTAAAAAAGEVLVHITICHSKKCHRPHTPSRHFSSQFLSVTHPHTPRKLVGVMLGSCTVRRAVQWSLFTKNRTRVRRGVQPNMRPCNELSCIAGRKVTAKQMQLLFCINTTLKQLLNLKLLELCLVAARPGELCSGLS